MNSERINVHELTVEEPEKESGLPFDSERDITEEDWELMRKQAEFFKKGYGGLFYERIMAMKILDPQRVLDVDSASWPPIKEAVDPYIHQEGWHDLIIGALIIRAVEPGLTLNISEDDWETMNKRLEANKGLAKEFFANTAAGMKILDPNVDLKLDRLTLDKLGHSLEDLRVKKSYYAFISLATAMKIIDPDYDLRLSKSDWRALKDQLDKFRRKEHDHFAKYNSAASELTAGFSRLAMEMKIIAAEKVWVTEKGLEIEMPDNHEIKQDIPPIPQNKQF